MSTVDPLARLFDPDDRAGWGPFAVAPGTAAGEIVHRIQAVVLELTGCGRFDDVRAYATALHALALDLLDATGAPDNGRRHPSHARFVEEINAEIACGRLGD